MDKRTKPNADHQIAFTKMYLTALEDILSVAVNDTMIELGNEEEDWDSFVTMFSERNVQQRLGLENLVFLAVKNNMKAILVGYINKAKYERGES